jgi:hypothetical protein
MGDLFDMAEFDQSIRQEPECPAAPTRRRASAGQGDEVGLLVAIEPSRTARYATANEDAIETPFDERATAIAPRSRALLICSSDHAGPRGLQSALSRMRARVNWRAAALPLATSDSNRPRSSIVKRTTNFLFMIGLRPRILVKPPGLDKSPRNLSIPG